MGVNTQDSRLIYHYKKGGIPYEWRLVKSCRSLLFANSEKMEDFTACAPHGRRLPFCNEDISSVHIHGRLRDLTFSETSSHALTYSVGYFCSNIFLRLSIHPYTLRPCRTKSCLIKLQPMDFLVFAPLIMFLGLFASDAHPQCTTTGNFSCGKWTNLTYPFWTMSQQHTNCNEFELRHCDTKKESPSIYLQDQELIVEDINQESKTMRISLPFGSSCVPLDANNSELQLPSQLNTSAIYFLYGCKHGEYLQEFPEFHCGTDWVKVYWAMEMDQPPPHTVNFCKNHFDVMNGTTLDDIRSSTNVKFWDKLLIALQTGFIVSIPQQPKEGVDRLSTTIIVVLGVCVPLGTALIMCASFVICQRYRKAMYARSSYYTRYNPSDPSSMTDPEKLNALYGVKFFMYDELKDATDNFSESREIGDGGFGTVYLGTLQDGRTVAVKRLYENNYKRVEQFLNEVDILARLHHKNLVTLYGCTSRHSRELLLVYEYISNGTVADHLHGENALSASLPWKTRMKIAVETASALAYLHASEIVHRDVKTNNILLDDHFNVKVADFGLSRLFPLDVTHVSTAPQGTPGYVDPEYRQCYQLTDKSDVYSFGVVLAELISSKPAVDITRHRHEINLSNMAISKIQNGALHELVDPSLGFDRNSDTHKMITAVAELAFQCLQSDQDSRPSMQDVLDILTRIQCGDSLTEDTAEEVDIFSDEFVLLENRSLPLSPDSMAAI